jgi:dGTPase
LKDKLLNNKYEIGGGIIMETGSKVASNPDEAIRLDNIEEHPIRTKFQRDRDRILYSRAFRRLDGKTQVFLATDDDHIRNRLTHTLEVSQIARTISKALALNEDLTEAIALGHDIGHTPFGHVGERTLNYIMNGCHKIKNFNSHLENQYKGFKHNWQSIRIVTKLEDKSLNLTDHTLWGMLNHSSIGKNNTCPIKELEKTYKLEDTYKREKDNIMCNLTYNSENCTFKGMQSIEFYYENFRDIDSKINFLGCWNFEGLVVAIADEIAQRHHDVEDALEYDLISRNDLINEIKNSYKSILTEQNSSDLEKWKSNSMTKSEYMKEFSTFIVDLLISNVIHNSKIKISELEKKFNITDNKEFYKQKQLIFQIKTEKGLKKIISFNDEMECTDKKFSKFLKQRVLNSFKAQRMDGMGKYIIIKLFEAYIENPQQLPDKTIKHIYKNLSEIEKTQSYNDKSVGELRIKLNKDHYKGEAQFNSVLLRTICDYIAGMTDRYAINEHKKLYNC